MELLMNVLAIFLIGFLSVVVIAIFEE